MAKLNKKQIEQFQKHVLEQIESISDDTKVRDRIEKEIVHRKDSERSENKNQGRRND